MKEWVRATRIAALAEQLTGPNGIETAVKTASSLQNNCFLWSLNYYVREPPSTIASALTTAQDLLEPTIFEQLKTISTRPEFRQENCKLKINVRKRASAAVLGRPRDLLVARAVWELTHPGVGAELSTFAVNEVDEQIGAIVEKAVGDEWCAQRARRLEKTAAALNNIKRQQGTV